MTQVVTTEEPTVVREERVEHVHDYPVHGSGAGRGTAINVTAPRASTGR